MEDWLRAIWNGPFYIGLLERPVSVGDVLMKLLETAWRGAVILVALTAALIAYFLVTSEMNKRARGKAQDDVTINAVIDTRICPQTAPIQVRVMNPSDRTMASIYYSVVIENKGRDIAPPHFRTRQFEFVAPKTGRTLCLSPWSSDTGDTEVMVGDLEANRVYGTIISADAY